MKNIKLQRKIKAIGGTFSLLLGIGVLSATGARAQQHRHDKRQQDNHQNQQRVENNHPDYSEQQDDRAGNNGRARRDDRYNDNNYGYNNAYENAKQQGYNDGLIDGRQDAQRGVAPVAHRTEAFRRGGNGGSYNNRSGSNRAFLQAYREGFNLGYHEGYNRDNYNGNQNRRRRNNNY